MDEWDEESGVGGEALYVGREDSIPMQGGAATHAQYDVFGVEVADVGNQARAFAGTSPVRTFTGQLFTHPPRDSGGQGRPRPGRRASRAWMSLESTTRRPAIMRPRTSPVAKRVWMRCWVTPSCSAACREVISTPPALPLL